MEVWVVERVVCTLCPKILVEIGLRNPIFWINRVFLTLRWPFFRAIKCFRVKFYLAKTVNFARADRMAMPSASVILSHRKITEFERSVYPRDVLLGRREGQGERWLDHPSLCHPGNLVPIYHALNTFSSQYHHFSPTSLDPKTKCHTTTAQKPMPTIPRFHTRNACQPIQNITHSKYEGPKTICSPPKQDRQTTYKARHTAAQIKNDMPHYTLPHYQYAQKHSNRQVL